MILRLKEIFKHFNIYLILLSYLLICFLQGFIYTGFNFGIMSHSDNSSIKNKNKINPDNMSNNIYNIRYFYAI